MTPAKDIHLSKKALHLLKKIYNQKSLKWALIEKTAEYKTLMYFALIDHQRNSKTGNLTEKGMQVLLCHKQAGEDRKQEHRHNWFVAIFSTFGGAILSKPLWDGIERLIELIQEIL